MSQKLSEFGLIPLRASRRKDGALRCVSSRGRRAFSELSGSLKPGGATFFSTSTWSGLLWGEFRVQSNQKCANW